ncbi:hypothetical protein I552_9899 [Mycobacterium xenopi 3993]|nr:hypothetical protein I552_9899 [Mycobacterium xenopi 3993]
MCARRASSLTALVVSVGSRTDRASRPPGPRRRAGTATWVPRDRQAPCPRRRGQPQGRDRPASACTGDTAGRGQRLAVIAGEYFTEQDRQRPAIHHDVVHGQHQSVPTRAGVDQCRPKRRLVQVGDCGAFGRA